VWSMSLQFVESVELSCAVGGKFYFLVYVR